MRLCSPESTGDADPRAEGTRSYTEAENQHGPAEISTISPCKLRWSEPLPNPFRPCCADITDSWRLEPNGMCTCSSDVDVLGQVGAFYRGGRSRHPGQRSSGASRWRARRCHSKGCRTILGSTLIRGRSSRAGCPPSGSRRTGRGARWTVAVVVRPNVSIERLCRSLKYDSHEVSIRRAGSSTVSLRLPKVIGECHGVRQRVARIIQDRRLRANVTGSHHRRREPRSKSQDAGTVRYALGSLRNKASG